MNAALLHLLWRDSLGKLRSAWRRVRTPRGAASASVFALLFGGLFYAAYFASEESVSFGVGSDGFQRFGPYGLLGLVALGVVAPRGLYFPPAEVAFLFPAPLSRRDLVLYNVATRARLAALSALWLGVFPSLRGSHLANTLIGYLLCLLLVQVSAQAFAVGRLWLAERRRTRAALGIGAALVLAGAWGTGQLAALASAVVAPLRPFIETISAPTAAVGLAWASLAFAIVAAVVAITCAMDVAFHEAALARSRRLEAQRQRMRSGGGPFASGPRWKRLRAPAFPRLEGAGPLAWRQCTELLRNPRGAGFVILAVALAVAVTVTVADIVSEGSTAVIAGMTTILATPLLMGDNLAFDFRRDLDRMGLLKSLPVSSLALSAGEILPAVIFLSLVQAAGIAIVGLPGGELPLAALPLLALVLPALNWCAVSIDNALFLLMPYRTVPDDPGDVTFVGRMMLGMLAKIVTLLAVGGGALFVGAAVYGATAGSLAVAAGAVWLLLICGCAPLTLLVAWAFRRFDVSRDVPD